MNQKKRSQVTLIMAIAIAIVVVFSIFYFVARSSSKKKLEAGVEGALTKDVQPIKEFVSQCLSKTAKEGLLLIGRQGGVIFKSDDPNFNQGGLTVYDGSFGVDYLRRKNGDIVNYGLIESTDMSGTGPYKNYLAEGLYPWTRFPDEGEDGQVHNFGWKGYPPLRITDGGYSIEAQLENFITVNIDDCLKDISQFENQGFSIKRGERKVDAVIGDNDVSILFVNPIEIIDTSTDGKAEFSEFNDVKNIRIGFIYDRIKRHYVGKDISNIMYEPPNFDDGGKISIKILNDEYERDDVVSVEDSSSTVDNKPYIFQYGRKNRRPAIFFIPYDEKDKKTPPTKTGDGDVLVQTTSPEYNKEPDILKECLDEIDGKKCCAQYTIPEDSNFNTNFFAADPDCDDLKLDVIDEATGNSLPQAVDSSVLLEVLDGNGANSLRDFYKIKMT